EIAQSKAGHGILVNWLTGKLVNGSIRERCKYNRKLRLQQKPDSPFDACSLDQSIGIRAGTCDLRSALSGFNRDRLIHRSPARDLILFA
ncbi:MAG TPA: hypothetical protein VFF59_01470, partial [Anaerolineae bacterium]|nr:hypothetical protein [Anaerolineae bacterium]